MDEQKSIKPDILELFDKVRAQADEYSHAFETLYKRIENLKQIDKKINENMEIIKYKNEEFQSLIYRSINEKFVDIEKKISKINEIWQNLDFLIKIQDEIFDFYEKIQNKFYSIEKNFNTILNDSVRKIDVTIQNIQNQLKNDLESYTSKSELRLILQSKKNESIIQSYNDNLSETLNTMKFEINNLKNEIINIKEKVDLNYVTENLTRINIHKKINEMDVNINNLRGELDLINKGYDQLQNNLYTLDIEKYAQFQSEIRILNGKFTDFEKKTSKMKTSLISLIILIVIIIGYMIIQT